MEEALVRLRSGDGSNVMKENVPETSIEQVKHRMFRTSDVEVWAAPVLFFFNVYQSIQVLRVEVAKVIPAGACPLRHGVGFPDCGYPIIAFRLGLFLRKGFTCL